MPRALLLIVALVFGSPSHVLAAYTSLYTFGDSLSDNGNAFILSEGLWPPSPPYAERFSNGPVAAELLAARLGIEFAPSELGGTGYAVGGATTGTRNYSFEVQDPFPLPAALQHTGLLSQVGSFVGTSPSFDPATSLFLVWAGANDFFLALAKGEDPIVTLETALNNIATAVGLLAAVGATDLLVPNMPDLALTPFGRAQSPEVQAALAGLSLAFNTELSTVLDGLRDALLLNLTEFDVAGLLGAIADDPGAFGFTNVTDACLDAGPAVVLAGCPGYLFFDIVHPTAAAHRLLGELFFAQINPVPEPAGWALLGLALAAAWAGGARPRAAARAA